MRPGEYEPVGSAGDLDSGTPFFGLDDEDASNEDYRPERQTRLERRQHSSHKRRGRFGIAIVLVLLAGIALGVMKVVSSLGGPDDYSGTGSGAVDVTITAGSSLSDMGSVLYKDHVVKSAGAFNDAANANPKATSIQAGVYRLRQHMSGKSAVLALLDPANRDADGDVLVPEGATVVDVEARLVKALGASQKGAITSALKNASDLGLPSTYGKLPNSVEGFLYPATYTFDPGTKPSEALQTMVLRYIAQDRNTGFTTAAKAAHLTPYDALIIASIAQAEAKFPADMPKVARVILNRIKAGMPLQIDATSAYAAKLEGLDPAKVIYNQIDSPYNTYRNDGLPPTPIGNPGESAMNGAVHAAAGNWLYYVNGDKAGHLFFTNDANKFAAAVAACQKNNWGCA